MEQLSQYRFDRVDLSCGACELQHRFGRVDLSRGVDACMWASLLLSSKFSLSCVIAASAAASMASVAAVWGVVADEEQLPRMLEKGTTFSKAYPS